MISILLLLAYFFFMYSGFVRYGGCILLTLSIICVILAIIMAVHNHPIDFNNILKHLLFFIKNY
jgi:hypothetical protein